MKFMKANFNRGFHPISHLKCSMFFLINSLCLQHARSFRLIARPYQRALVYKKTCSSFVLPSSYKDELGRKLEFKERFEQMKQFHSSADATEQFNNKKSKTGDNIPTQQSRFLSAQGSTTGILESLPRSPVASQLYEAAERMSRKIKADRKVSNIRQQTRKMAAQRLDSLGKEISQPLSTLIREYKESLASLHPFEATLADLTVRARAKRGHKTLLAQLEEVNELRKMALIMCKEAAGKANKANSKKEALEILDKAYADVEAFLKENADILLELNQIQQAVSKLPVVDLQLPTLVLVGAPNVGKSSIVRSISTGTPEINNYPFTTRGMTMGHMYHPDSGEKFQVMDTPGVLSRPDSERNEMEALTLASMQHLPTAVMFVMDMSGLSGDQSSIEKQIEVRNELRSRFPKRPWVDVVSKSDLPRLQNEILDELNWGHHSISVKSGDGIEPLCTRVISMLEEVQGVLLALGMSKKN